MNFAGKAIIVTGGASGIGAAAARRFAQEGAMVLIADRDETGARDVREAIVETGAETGAETGGRAEPVVIDVTLPADNRRMVEACRDHFGRCDGAFLNAGAMNRMGSFAELDEETFERMLSVNLKSAFLGLKAVLPVLERGGAAVVTASGAGVTGLPLAAGYSASKHGVVGLVRSASKAFAERGARVNCICPGMVETPLIGFMEAPEIVAPDALPVPAHGGSLRPQHVAELALFLASGAAAGINGQAIIADGGFLAAYPEMENPPEQP